MNKASFDRLFGARNKRAFRKDRRSHKPDVIEVLEDRAVPAVIAVFSPSIGSLTVIGDAQSNNITVGRDAGGKILINGGVVSINGGQPTVANTSIVQVFGLDGDDTIAIDETNGALPRANLFGGNGNDTLIGGSGADMLFGQNGNDTLLGRGGDDFLFGGAGDDVLTAGSGNDQVFGQSGDDRMVWNPGDGTDLNEGGSGDDTVEVNGGNGAEDFTLTANGTRVRFDRINPAPFSIDIGTSENLVVNMNGGNDTFTAGNGLAPLIMLTVDGGAGDDLITGGDGNDILLGGDGNDTVTGGRGNDVVFLGAGDDVFVWNPGDGSDTIEGQAGFDTMQFNGSNASENIDISANGNRLRFFRNVGNVVMDTNDLERVNFEALGGADAITVGDLSGTDVKEINVDLAGTPGGAGDGTPDSVSLNDSNGSDHVDIFGQAGSIAVVGLPTLVTINSVEATDSLRINGNAGDDTISANTLTTPVAFSADGGAGDDTLVGTDQADLLLGGDGNDFVDGRRGNDVAFLGAGDDVFVWNPGDGSDTIEGQAGNDEMLFNGSNASENIDISANGGRLRFFRDVANVLMDTNGVERVTFNAFGGADTITVGDLSGTEVNLVQISLSGGSGQSGDGLEDRIIVNGTAGADNIGVSSTNSEVVVSGLTAQVRFTGMDVGIDRLDVNALAGADKIDASGLQANVVRLSMFGGDGDDLLIGSAGNDIVNGGRGNDVALLGAGDDIFVWNPGDGSDTIEGQAGRDEMLFNGANVSENIDISANGYRLRFFRNVGNVVMDTNGVEDVTFNARGGADTITVGDLSGTDVTDINLNLSAVPGDSAGDGQLDTVVVNGTNRDDTINVLDSATGTQVTGLSATISITGADKNLDRLQVNGLAGDDTIDATALTNNEILLVADGGVGDDILIGGTGDDILIGGAGDDILIGGDGNDVLDGGDGDDVLIGGPGLDFLDGGTGDNVLIQD